MNERNDSVSKYSVILPSWSPERFQISSASSQPRVPRGEVIA